MHTDSDVFLQDATAVNTRAIDPGDPAGSGYPLALPVLLISAALVILVVGISIYAYRRWRHKQASQEAAVESGMSGNAGIVANQICMYPPAKPHIQSATTVQPPSRTVTRIISNKQCGGCGTPTLRSPINTPTHTPLHTPPLRLKKGLLERRGSNASLVLDLASSSPEVTEKLNKSSPKDSSTQEYLLSAGNRMSRKQLRNCLKDIKAIHQEHMEIPTNHQRHFVVAGSGTKNRYKIIPNETTRVILSQENSDPLSEYINANFIRGYGGEARAYIATQGPMQHTVTDFWRMVWQEKAPVIIMITKLWEASKEKCSNYMPDKTTRYGDLEVTVTQCTEFPGYILRELTLKVANKEHVVRHYWYISWPDHRIPDTARLLVDLVQEVEKYHHHQHDPTILVGPVIVHCSAGIGRTGCFIATSIGIKQLREEYMVDILGIVCAMRQDRGGMVETMEQYEFIHRALCLYEKDLPPLPTSAESQRSVSSSRASISSRASVSSS